MTGFEQRSGAATFLASWETSHGERSRKPAMSPPAVNAPPAPVRTTKRIASSRSSSTKTAESWSRAVIETRLSFPGTSSVIVATRAVTLDPEPVVVAHTVAPVSSRSTLRRIFPEARLRERVDEHGTHAAA